MLVIFKSTLHRNGKIYFFQHFCTADRTKIWYPKRVPDLYKYRIFMIMNVINFIIHDLIAVYNLLNKILKRLYGTRILYLKYFRTYHVTQEEYLLTYVITNCLSIERRKNKSSYVLCLAFRCYMIRKLIFLNKMWM